MIQFLNTVYIRLGTIVSNIVAFDRVRLDNFGWIFDLMYMFISNPVVYREDRIGSVATDAVTPLMLNIKIFPGRDGSDNYIQ